MGIIQLENIKVFAHHGCLPEETVIGSDYRVDLEVKADLSASEVSDQLSETVDYVQLNRIVVEEMRVPSKLLENVAKRIVDRVFSELVMVRVVKVKLAKINPPICGNVAKVAVILKRKRVL